MEFEWYEGFEHYRLNPNVQAFGQAPDGTNNTSMLIQGLWAAASNATIQSNIVRTGGYSCQIVLAALRRPLSAEYAQVSCAFGYYMVNLPFMANGPMVLAQWLDDTSNSHVCVKINPAGRVEVWKSGNTFNSPTAPTPVLMGTSTLSVAAGTFNHFEFRVKIDAATGFAKVRVNGVTFLSLTGINTVGEDTVGLAGQIAFGQYGYGLSTEFNSQAYIDDVVVAHFLNDGSEDDAWICGSDGKEMWGVYYLKPNADTAVADWELTTGTHGYSLINEIEPHDDTAFIFSGAANDKSAFDVEPLPANITQVGAVMNIARLKKTDTGAANVALAVISDTTEDIADDFPLVTNYAWNYHIWDTDPHSSAAWDPLDLPSIEVERTA